MAIPEAEAPPPAPVSAPASPFDFDNADPPDDSGERRPTRSRRRQPDGGDSRTSWAYVGGGAVLFLIGAGFIIGMWPSMSLAITNPRTVTAAELKQIQTPPKGADRWVVYQADRVSDTGLGTEEERTSRTDRTRFVLVPVQDRWLIAEVNEEFTGTRLEGQLEVWDGGLAGEAVNKIRQQHAEERDKFLPYQMNAAGGSARASAVAMLLGMVAFVLFGLGSMGYGGVLLMSRR
jgi:hypothetical protein